MFGNHSITKGILKAIFGGEIQTIQKLPMTSEFKTYFCLNNINWHNICTISIIDLIAKCLFATIQECNPILRYAF